MRRTPCSLAIRSTRSSTCSLVWPTTITRSPRSARLAAAATTRVDFPAPGGESTTTPRSALARSARMASVTARALTAAFLMLTPGFPGSRPVLSRVLVAGHVLRRRAAVGPRRVLLAGELRRGLEVVTQRRVRDVLPDRGHAAGRRG